MTPTKVDDIIRDLEDKAMSYEGLTPDAFEILRSALHDAFEWGYGCHAARAREGIGGRPRNPYAQRKS